MAGRPGEGDTAPTCTGPLSPISSSGARRLSCSINPPQLGGYYRLVPARQDGLLCPSVARVAKQRYRSRKKKREWDRVQGVYDERCRGAGSNSRCKVVIAPAPCFFIKSSVCFWLGSTVCEPFFVQITFRLLAAVTAALGRRVSGPTRESSLVDISLHLKQF